MLNSLIRRRRGWRLGVLLNGVPQPAKPVTVHGGPLPTRTAVPASGDGSPATDRILSRLTADDIETALRAMGPERRDALPPGGVERDRALLAFTVEADPPGLVDKLGLSTVMPPDEVHHLGDGPLATGGDFFGANHVAAVFERSGAPLDDAADVLDFGASSGRTARVLDSAYPGVQFHACDPIPGAIEWGREHLPAIDWFVSPLRPPLDVAADSYDAAYAWSVWSHFGAEAGIAWLEEMRRVIRPGGHLVISTHGWHTLDTYAERGIWSPIDLRRLRDELYITGFAYRDVFGPDGDGGVPQEDWGNSWMTLEWLAGRVCPQWSIVSYEQARVDATQDVVVLRRES